MDRKQIRLEIQAEVKKAVKALNKVEKEQKDIKKQNDILKTSFAGIGSAIVAAFSVQAITQFLSSSVQLAAQTISLEKSFRNLGKAVGFNDKSLEKFRKATDGTVSDIDLMIEANNAMLLGIVENDDQFAELIDSAQRLAKAVGQDALFGIQSLTTGIGRQSKLMLDNLGIVLDTNLAYEKFAEANGKAAKDLDENERKQAFIQAALESTKEKVDQLGEEQLDLNDATNQLSVSFENLQITIGKELQDEVGFLQTALSNLLDVANQQIAEKGLLATLFGMPKVFDVVDLVVDVGQKAKKAAESIVPPDKPLIPLLPSEDDFLEDLEVAEENFEEINRIIAKHEEGRKKSIEFIKKLEADAHKERIAQNLESAILQGQSAKEAGVSVIKAEIAKSTASLITKIMQGVPFPLNLALAAGAGGMIGKVTDQLFSSFATGGSFVTKGRTTLPIGSGVVVGDNASGMERIDVTPLPSPTSRNNGNIIINISAPLVDETVVDTIIPAIRRAEKLNL